MTRIIRDGKEELVSYREILQTIAMGESIVFTGSTTSLIIVMSKAILDLENRIKDLEKAN